MAYEIINTIKGASVIRVVDTGTTTIALSDLRANANIETILSASLTDVAWTTSGFISITRANTPVLNLYGSGSWTSDDVILRKCGANNKSNNIVVVISGGGSLLLGVSKDATLNVDAGRVILNG